MIAYICSKKNNPSELNQMDYLCFFKKNTSSIAIPV